MISGVAATDDVGFSSAITEIKPTSETGEDPQSARQKTGTSQTNADPAVQGTALPYDGFGDRFTPESAQTLLDAQESLPAATSRSPSDGAPYTGNQGSETSASVDTATSETDPLDTDRNGIVSFGEWRKDQGDDPLDTNRDGTVSYGEWQDTLGNKPLDTDQDGTVEFGEWLKSRNSDTGVSGEDQPSVTVTAVDGSMFE
jgi:hypothetical protein